MFFKRFFFKPRFSDIGSWILVMARPMHAKIKHELLNVQIMREVFPIFCASFLGYIIIVLYINQPPSRALLGKPKELTVQ